MTGADIDVSFGGEVGKFEFRGTSCTVTGNENWGTGSTVQEANDPEIWVNIANKLREGEETRAKWVFNMEKKSITSKSSSWTLNPTNPTLSNDNKEIITLTHGTSSGLLTHTNASATLDDLYNHLHNLAKQPTSVEIPLNELATPFGLYDWELGLHAPMLLMDKLTNSQQYDKALEIARFVLNPLASSKKHSSLLRVWKWAPFRGIYARSLVERIRSQHVRGSADQVDSKGLERALAEQTACKDVLKTLSAI